jgi:predicted enzyme involved in methoxymalonyl-ACP biosynthesis
LTFLTLYGRLADRFGDNGLVSVLIGRAINETLEMDLWLMSCRVINREMELAMFDAVVEQCQARGIRKIVGIYIPSKKNGMVADHYLKLGFTTVEGSSESRQLWHYEVPQSQPAKARYIRRTANQASAIVDGAVSTDARTEPVDREGIGKEPGSLIYN